MLTICYSCHRDCPAPMPTDCVPQEVIKSKDTGFYVWTSGKEKDGFATAIKLNKEWRASAEARYDQGKLYLYFTTYSILSSVPEYEYKKDFIFIILNSIIVNECNSIFLYPDTANSNGVYQSLEDDAIRDSYKVNLEMANSNVILDSFDLLGKRVAGKFRLSFDRDTRRIKKEGDPEFVRFFNGEFHCNIVN